LEDHCFPLIMSHFLDFFHQCLPFGGAVTSSKFYWVTFVREDLHLQMVLNMPVGHIWWLWLHVGAMMQSAAASSDVINLSDRCSWWSRMQ
jgi:hypothetical protein